MSRIKAKNSRIELLVRSFLHRNGFRFRLHKKELPGNPDIVLTKYRTVIFVHGCFWHKHENCKYAYTPKSKTEFWQSKFKRNIERDKEVKEQLQLSGWHVITVWECEIKNKSTQEGRLSRLVEEIRGNTPNSKSSLV